MDRPTKTGEAKAPERSRSSSRPDHTLEFDPDRDEPLTCSSKAAARRREPDVRGALESKLQDFPNLPAFEIECFGRLTNVNDLQRAFGELLPRLRDDLPREPNSPTAPMIAEGGGYRLSAILLHQRKASGRVDLPLPPRRLPRELPPRPEVDPESALGHLSQVVAAVDAERGRVAAQLQSILTALGGKSFATLEERQLVARQISDLTEFTRTRVQCPKCLQPAMLRCSTGGNAKEGAFQFTHNYPQKTVHGSTSVLPSGLTLVPVPGDKSKISKEKKKL